MCTKVVFLIQNSSCTVYNSVLPRMFLYRSIYFHVTAIGNSNELFFRFPPNVFAHNTCFPPNILAYIFRFPPNVFMYEYCFPPFQGDFEAWNKEYEIPWFLIPSCNMPQITVCFDADCALNCRRLRSNSMQNTRWFDANRSTFSCDFNSCFALNFITYWLSMHCKTLKNGTYFEKE